MTSAQAWIFFFHILVYNLLWFTFTVCATTSYRREGGGRRRSAERRGHPEMLTNTRQELSGLRSREVRSCDTGNPKKENKKFQGADKQVIVT